VHCPGLLAALAPYRWQLWPRCFPLIGAMAWLALGPGVQLLVDEGFVKVAIQRNGVTIIPYFF
jgi:hypothetical protein